MGRPITGAEPGTSPAPGDAGDPRREAGATPASIDDLTREAYSELHRIAVRCMRGQRSDHTLQPTALVHEAFLRLVRRGYRWESRTEFLAVAATAMRRVLIDCARRRASAKRGGGRRVTLTDGHAIQLERPIDILALDEALDRLATLDPRAGRVVELRFFGGLEVDEVATALGTSTATVKRDWRFARAWLGRELDPEADRVADQAAGRETDSQAGARVGQRTARELDP